MLFTIIYVFLALLAFSLLIILHELGHLVAALWAGMRVETCSLGFGKAIYSFKARGIEWKLGWIPLGGYVQILGMSDEKQANEPGSYQSTPAWKRMIVVGMGPLVNIVLAWLLFAGIWAAGGSLQPFSQVSGMVGWVDPTSELAHQMAPGDVVVDYGGDRLHSAKDHLYAPMLASGSMEISFEKINYHSGEQELRKMAFATYQHPEAADPGWKTFGILAPAKILTVRGFSPHAVNYGHTIASESVVMGHRIVGVNGERVFSDRQLQELLNDRWVVLSVDRQGKPLAIRVPTYPLSHLALSSHERLELGDWQYDANLKQIINDCTWIGYHIDANCIVEHAYRFLDPHDAEPIVTTLQPGDRIYAVQGVAIAHACDLLKNLQEPLAIIYIDSAKMPDSLTTLQAQAWFIERMTSHDLDSLLQKPLYKEIVSSGEFTALPALTLMPRGSLFKDQMKQWRAAALAIVDEREQMQAVRYIEHREQELVIGVQLSDVEVIDHPSAGQQFMSAWGQIRRTLGSLTTGNLSPRWLAGPVGMVTAMTQNISLGVIATLHWLAVVSLSLGVFNLLPLPVLDGGRLVLDGIEAVTGKKIPARILDVLAYVFLGVILLLMVTATYWDVWRLWALWKS